MDIGINQNQVHKVDEETAKEKKYTRDTVTKYQAVRFHSSLKYKKIFFFSLYL